MTVYMDVAGVADVLFESEQLCAKRLFDQAIALIEDNIEKINPKDRLNAWYLAFNIARAKGDTELAKRFMLLIDQVNPMQSQTDGAVAAA